MELILRSGERGLTLTPRDAVGLVQALLELLHVVGREKGGTAGHELSYLSQQRRRQQYHKVRLIGGDLGFAERY